jgi:pyridine nucleotide-disulfide oxidoreductase
MRSPTCQVVIVGAGPYGLAAAAHLRSAKADVCVFGKPMEFWERHMPAGMLLRSYWEGSHISDPRGDLTLDKYERAQGLQLPRPVRRDDFVSYGRWFQRQAVPDLDARRVTQIQAASEGYRVLLEDGQSVLTQRVVVATGIASFTHRPHQFGRVPPELASHSSEHHDFSGFAGQRVVVIGGGQSALESAALLHESGAAVEVIVRAPRVHWLRYGTRLHTWLHNQANPLRRILYPPSDVGPPGLNWIVDTPELFPWLPWSLHSRIARRAIRSAGAGWLKPRMSGTKITTVRFVHSASPVGKKVLLRLDDGTERCVDHVLLATGFQIDLSRCAFLPAHLVRSLRLVDGYPALSAGFEASLPGLHFIGATAARTFGPLMRFLAGTGFAARSLTRCVLGHATNHAEKTLSSYDWDQLAQTRTDA